METSQELLNCKNLRLVDFLELPVAELDPKCNAQACRAASVRAGYQFMAVFLTTSSQILFVKDQSNFKTALKKMAARGGILFS